MALEVGALGLQLAPHPTAPPDGDATTLAQAGIYNAVLRSDLWARPALGTGHTASVYKMRLRADPYKSQITWSTWSAVRVVWYCEISLPTLSLVGNMNSDAGSCGEDDCVY